MKFALDVSHARSFVHRHSVLPAQRRAIGRGGTLGCGVGVLVVLWGSFLCTARRFDGLWSPWSSCWCIFVAIFAALSGEPQLAGPVELRELFVRLGPTYIKFGQLIASSNGLFPERYVKEFQKCLDRVPPEPWELVVRQTLTLALGKPPEQVFTTIDTNRSHQPRLPRCTQ